MIFKSVTKKDGWQETLIRPSFSFAPSVHTNAAKESTYCLQARENPAELNQSARRDQADKAFSPPASPT